MLAPQLARRPSGAGVLGCVVRSVAPATQLWRIGTYPEVMRGKGEASAFPFEDTKPGIDDRDRLDDVGALAAHVDAG